MFNRSFILKVLIAELFILWFVDCVSFPNQKETKPGVLNSNKAKLDDGRRSNAYFSRLKSNAYSEGRASKDNAKFIGANNQEVEKTLHHIKKKKSQRRYFQDSSRPYRNPCRRSAKSVDPAASGKFLWDLNIYNVEAPQYSHDCDPLSDSAPPAYYYEEVPPARPFYNFLYSVFGPGGTHNPSVQQAYYDQIQADEGDGGGSATQAPLRPGDVIGGVSNTVNDVIRVILGMRPG